MKYSLLSKVTDREERCDVIYDLSIDRAVYNITNDHSKCGYFCNILSKPLTNTDNIKYRSEILEDLINNPELLDSLKIVFGRYDKIKSDWLELKSSGNMREAEAGSEAVLDYIYSSLKVTALFPKTILSFFQSITKAFDGYVISSEGLCAVRDYASKMTNNASFARIAEIASLFLYNSPEDYDFELICNLGDSFEAVNAAVCAVTPRTKDKSTVLNKLKLIRKKEQGVTSTDAQSIADSYSLLCDALSSIDSLLEEITNEIYSVFYGISRELDFYDVAISYVNSIKEKGIPLCYARFSDKAEICSLYDILLISENKEHVIPNDLNIKENKGVLIKGENNTGKTTFLRSIGTAQLFAQAGLPVPALSVTLPVRSAVMSHFSSAEEEFSVGDTSGRFEGEVKAIAQIMANIDKDTLVLLNESFQTTSYDEGARGIEHILRAIMSVGASFIFVTHLTPLFNAFDRDVLKLSGGDKKYTIKPIAMEEL